MIPAADQAQVPVLGQFFADNREYLEYVEDRPLPVYTKAQLVARFLAKLLTRYDCSWLVTQVCDLLGWADPSGPEVPSYVDGDGNTQTIFSYLPQVAGWGDWDAPNFSKAQVGFLVGFLPPPESTAHVTMISSMEDPSDPELISWGYQQSPVLVQYSVERLSHSGQMVGLFDTTKLVPASHFTPKPKEEVVGVAATTDSKGLVHVFQETSDGKVYSTRQVEPEGKYDAPFLLLDNGKASAKAVDQVEAEAAPDTPDTPDAPEAPADPAPVPVEEPLTPGAVEPVPDATPAPVVEQPAETPEAPSAPAEPETPPVEPPVEAPVEAPAPPVEPVEPAPTSHEQEIAVQLDAGGNGSTVVPGAPDSFVGAFTSSGSVSKEPVEGNPGMTLVRVAMGQPNTQATVTLSQQG